MNNEKPLWIIGSVLSVLLLPATFVAGLVTGTSLSSEVSLSDDTLSAWVAAFATVTIAVLTFILALETWKLRRNQDKQTADLMEQSIKPEIEVYLHPSKISFQFMNLLVENTGNGTAKDITFEIKGINGSDLSYHDKILLEQFNRLSFIKNKITSLGVKKNRSSYLFSFIELTQRIGQNAFNIKLNISVSFKNILGKEYTSECVIDLSEFKGITEVGDGDPIQNMVKETEKIRKTFEGIVHHGGHGKKLNIQVHTKKDQEKREAIAAEMLAQHQTAKK